MGYQEFEGKTLDDALTEASVSLGTPSSELKYEVVSEGSRGFLGIASKNAVIRVLDKEEIAAREKAAKAEKKAEKESEKAQKESVKEEKKVEKEAVKAEKKAEKPAEKKPENDAEIEKVVREFLGDVFSTMKLEVEIDVDIDDDSINVDLKGAEMGVLIGKRGQTLDSLQYLANLVVNRKTDSSKRVKIDTEDYRRRRKETLENLAKNVAYKVKRTKRPVELEPMNPYERRVIHSALQGDKFVTTHSEGEEPYRHVVVTLKK